MEVELIQLPILLLIFFVLLFGIGFILNMLLKTTYLPVYLYVILLLPLVVYLQWDNGQSLAGNLLGYQFTDYLTALAGLIGAWLGGKTIQTLRVKGYKMF